MSTEGVEGLDAVAAGNALARDVGLKANGLECEGVPELALRHKRTACTCVANKFAFVVHVKSVLRSFKLLQVF